MFNYAVQYTKKYSLHLYRCGQNTAIDLLSFRFLRIKVLNHHQKYHTIQCIKTTSCDMTERKQIR